jgi:dTMP kinase
VRRGPGHPRFVTFEGVDGAGKSTHLAWFAETLAVRTGAEVVLTREPGGTPVGEALRGIVLATPMDLETETMMMFAARREHVVSVIGPALARGAWVVCDRFTDATVAYQGAGRGLPRDRIEALRAWVHPDLEPGTTILFDLDPVIAQARMDGSREQDRFEREGRAFFDRVRAAYLALAAAEPDRLRVIDGAHSVNDIRIELEEILVSIGI